MQLYIQLLVLALLPNTHILLRLGIKKGFLAQIPFSYHTQLNRHPMYRMIRYTHEALVPKQEVLPYMIAKTV